MLYAKLIGRIALFTCENIAHIEFYLQGLLPRILAIYTIKGATSRFAHIEKLNPDSANSSFVCNPCQSFPSLAILVPSKITITIISFVFFYFIKLLFSGFLQFKGNFVGGQNKSKYRDPAGAFGRTKTRHYLSHFTEHFI